jgi:hypothetical protein
LCEPVHQGHNVKRLIEVRSYKLKAGPAAEFHNIVASTVAPMLRNSGMEVVSFGPSAHEPDGCLTLGEGKRRLAPRFGLGTLVERL